MNASEVMARSRVAFIQKWGGTPSDLLGPAPGADDAETDAVTVAAQRDELRRRHALAHLLHHRVRRDGALLAGEDQRRHATIMMQQQPTHLTGRLIHQNRQWKSHIFYQASIQLGATIGPVLGGYLAWLFDFRAPFWAYMLVGLAAAATAAFAFTDTLDPEERQIIQRLMQHISPPERVLETHVRVPAQA